MQYHPLHPWNVNIQEAVKIQKTLQEKIILQKLSSKIQKIAAADVSFQKNKGSAVVVVFSFPELEKIEQVQKIGEVNFPYVPGLLTFREGPLLISALAALKKEPDLILFDGQGIAHPRQMGIATHLGILFDKPTIGCAKTLLYGTYSQPSKQKGSFTPLEGRKRQGAIGVVLRTREKVKPIFVSPGYKIDIKTAVNIVLKSSPRFRIPEPLRQAHRLSKQPFANT